MRHRIAQILDFSFLLSLSFSSTTLGFAISSAHAASFGYSRLQSGTHNVGGKPNSNTPRYTNKNAGIWSGYFGTVFNFDADNGDYFVMGENTWTSLTGPGQLGTGFMQSRQVEWSGMLGKSSGRVEQHAEQCTGA